MKISCIIFGGYWNLTVQVERELFSFFASFFLFSKESGESPLTLRPNFNCEKGNVTAAAAACMPRRGSFVDRKCYIFG